MWGTEVHSLAEKVRDRLRVGLPSDITFGEITETILPPRYAPPELRKQGFPDIPMQFITCLPVYWDTPKGQYEMPFDITSEKLKEITDEEIGEISQSIKRGYKQTRG